MRRRPRNCVRLAVRDDEPQSRCRDTRGREVQRAKAHQLDWAAFEERFSAERLEQAEIAVHGDGRHPQRRHEDFDSEFSAAGGFTGGACDPWARSLTNGGHERAQQRLLRGEPQPAEVAILMINAEEGNEFGAERAHDQAPVEKAVKRDKKSDKDSNPTDDKKKRGPNPAFAERKKRQKARVFTCINTGFTKLCRDDSMGTLVQDCIWKSSFIAVEASLLTSFHILRLLEAQQQLPVMDDTFFNQCVSCIANQGINLTCEGRNPAMESLTQYKTLQPTNQ